MEYIQLANPGDVFFSENFVFSDGTSGKKLLVLLNCPSPGDNCLFVKTTSQQKKKPNTPGCIDEYHKVFHLPQKKDFFKEPTWVQLDDYFPFQQDHVNKKLKQCGCLQAQTISSIISCFLKINDQDLSPKVKGMLISPVTQGAMTLAEKFNRKK